MPLQIRRGTEAERQALASSPAQGELIWITDDRKLYIGDGNTLARNLIPVTGYDDSDAKEAAGEVLTGGTHDSINFTYNAGSQTIDANVDLSNYIGNVGIVGSVTASSFIGSLFADDSSSLVNAVDGSINLDGTVKGFIIPDQTDSYDIGSVSNKFRDIHLSGEIELGNATISSSGSVIDLPEGSTVAGIPLAAPFEGTDLNVNIIGDDSTVMVNTSTEVITAQGGFIGDITGNVTGDVTGDVTGIVTGYHIGDMTGSVFGDDSTRLVDGVNNRLFTSLMTFDENTITTINQGRIFIGSADEQNALTITSYGTDPGLDIIGELSGTAGDGGAGLTQLGGIARFASWKGGFDSPTAAGANDMLGQIQFAGYVNQGPEGVLQADLIGIKGMVDEVGDATTNYATGKLQFIIVDKTDVAGSRYAEFEGSQGVFSAPVFKPGSYANDSARDATITSPEAGMIIFNQRDDSTGVPVFQGYDGTSWVDLN